LLFLSQIDKFLNKIKINMGNCCTGKDQVVIATLNSKNGNKVLKQTQEAK